MYGYYSHQKRQRYTFNPAAAAVPPQIIERLVTKEVREGDSVNFQVRVTGNPQPEVTWFRENAAITSSPDFEIQQHGEMHRLHIPEAFYEDSGKFSVRAVNRAGQTTSTAELIVEAPAAGSAVPPAPAFAPVSRQPETAPVFQTKLSNQPCNQGQVAHFECKVKAFPPPEILWTRRGHPLVDKARYQSTYDQYNGVTTLTILNLCPEDEGEYTCTAINSQGETSTSALLLGADRYQAWLHEQDNKDRQTAVVSELDTRLAEKQARQPADFYRPMSEKILDTRLDQQPAYQAPAADPGFKVSSFEQRLLDEIDYREGQIAPQHRQPDHAAFAPDVADAQAPRFDQKLKDFQLMEGSDATFVCKVHGQPVPFVTWYHNGRLIRPSNRYEMKITRDGYATLRVRIAFPEDAGHYTCCATNIMGRDTCSGELYIEGLGQIDDTSYVSKEALQRLTRSPASRGQSQEPGGVSEKYYRPIFRKIPADQEVPETKMCRFDSVVTGRPMPDIVWYRDEDQVYDDENHKIVVNEDGFHSLIIYATQRTDSGLYTCVARNRGGEDKFQVRLNVTAQKASEAPRFVERLTNQNVRQNEAFEFVAETTGYPVPMMSWQKDGRHVDRDPRFRIRNEGHRSSLSCERADARDTAWYQCTAANVAGTATNRARLTVQVDPRKPTPERKLFIPKRTTPTPTRQMEDSQPEAKRRPSSEPPKQARANIVLSPSPAPMEVQPSLISPAQQVPQHRAAPPPTAAKPDRKLFRPDDSDLMAYIRETEAAPDHVDSAPAPPAPRMSPTAQRPPTQVLIQQGVYPEPADDEMFKKETPRPPKFVTQIKPQTRLKETEPAHFESKLVPIGDPDMVVEWFKDGVPLKYGSRYMPVNDFGYVALDILWTYPEDSGLYTCRATNKHGSAETMAHIKCYGKESVIYDSQLPDGQESVHHLHVMEEQIRRDRIPKERLEEGPHPSAPVFDLMPEMQQVEEGDTVKFMCKVSGHPRPRITWWVNGTIIVNGHRFKLRYDGMINVLEIPKVREYDSGSIKVVAKNPMGEAECSTTLVVVPHEDWRSRLKQAPRSTVGLELEKQPRSELRSVELDNALKRPRTTVTELRAFERSAQERAHAYRDDEVKDASQAIISQHAHMHRTDAYHELRIHEPNMQIQTEAHIERAKHMLGMEGEPNQKQEAPRVARTGKSDEAPSFSKPLMNVKAKEGKPVKMEVTFGGFPYPDVTWYREGLEIRSSSDFRITTLNNKSFLLISDVLVDDAGVFTVRATNKFGMVECRAALDVTEDPNKPRDVAPVFTSQMHDITVRVGEPATFDVQVSGHPRPEVQWTKDGKRIYESKRWKFIADGDHFTFLIYEVTEYDRGVYECIVVNKLGRTSCSASLTPEGKAPERTIPTTAAEPPKLITTLKDAQVNEGESVAMSCKILAVPEPMVQWFYNNQLIKPSKYFQMFSDKGVHTLHIAGAFPEDEGIYKCVARNQVGEVTCIAHLKVIAATSEVDGEPMDTMEPPRFARPVSAMEVKKGSPAQFEVEVSGQPAPEVTWYREGHQILHSEDFQLLQDGNRYALYIKEVFPEDSGIFTCRLTNGSGVAECSAELLVEDPTQVSQAQMKFAGPAQTAPKILKAPSPAREIVAGTTTKLTVQLAAYPSPRFTWYVNGVEIRPSQRHKVTYDNGLVTLIIIDAQPQDSGEYMLRATNDLGEISCKTVLTISPTQKVVQLPMETAQQVTMTSSARRQALKTEVTPTFTKPMPPEIRVRERAIAKLEAYVEAYPPPLITWHVNGSEIKPSPKYTVKHEGNKAILLVKNVCVDDAGTYACKATSDLGEVVCSTTLFVTGAAPKMAPPRFRLQLQPTSAIDGNEVTLTCQVEGQPMPDIYWFHNDKSIDKNEDFVISYDRKSGNIELVIVDCLLEDSGVFKCVARNPGGQDVTQCTLDVQPAPQEPRPERVVQKAPKTKLIVQQGDKEVMRTAVESEIDRTSHQKEVKVIKRIVKKQSGQPPKFSQPIHPQVVKEADNAMFTAVVSGAPQPEIVWLKDRVALAPSTKHVMGFEPDTGTCTLTIINATPSDVGVYSCRAENLAGKATCTANVVVVHRSIDAATQLDKHMKPPVFKRAIKQVSANVGDNIRFCCSVDGCPMPSVVWQHEGRKIKMNERVYMKFGRQSGEWLLHVDDVSKQDGGHFRCVASNPAGEAISEAALVVNAADNEVGADAGNCIEYETNDDVTADAWKVQQQQSATTVVHSVESTEHDFSEGDQQESLLRTSERKFAKQFKIEEDTKTETYLKSEHEIALKAGELSSYDCNVVEQNVEVEEQTRPIEGQTVSADVALAPSAADVERQERREKSVKGGQTEANVTQMQVQKSDVVKDGSRDPAKTHVTVTTKTGQAGDASIVETETVAVTTSVVKGVVKETHTDTRVTETENQLVTDVTEFNMATKQIETETKSAPLEIESAPVLADDEDSSDSVVNYVKTFNDANDNEVTSQVKVESVVIDDVTVLGSAEEEVSVEDTDNTVTMVTDVVTDPTEEVKVTEEVDEHGQVVKKITKTVTGAVTKTTVTKASVAQEVEANVVTEKKTES